MLMFNMPCCYNTVKYQHTHFPFPPSFFLFLHSKEKRQLENICEGCEKIEAKNRKKPVRFVNFTFTLYQINVNQIL